MSGEEIITNCGFKKETNVEITQVDYKIDHKKTLFSSFLRELLKNTPKKFRPSADFLTPPLILLPVFSLPAEFSDPWAETRSFDANIGIKFRY